MKGNELLDFLMILNDSLQLSYIFNSYNIFILILRSHDCAS